MASGDMLTFNYVKSWSLLYRIPATATPRPRPARRLGALGPTRYSYDVPPFAVPIRMRVSG